MVSSGSPSSSPAVIQLLVFLDQLSLSFICCQLCGQDIFTLEFLKRSRFQQKHYFELEYHDFINLFLTIIHIQSSPMNKKDLFGFQTQGKKYDIYRPRYPSKLLKNILQNVKGRNRYLDVATGTGQILFQLYDNFQFSQGLDLSQNMINVCKEKLIQKNIKNIQLRCQDFIPAKIQNKYDLITIGQALHWLPIREFLQKSKSSLNQGGVLGVYGYILKRIEGNTKSEEQNKFYQQLYYQFYDKKVKKNFDFDRDQLHTHYSDKKRYPFQQIFSKVDRQVIEVNVQMDKHGLISYLKTFSGYNTYLERYPQQKDPIKDMQQKIEEQKKINCTFDYFCVYCSN